MVLFEAQDQVNVAGVVEFIQSLQQEDGSFWGDKWGESAGGSSTHSTIRIQTIDMYSCFIEKELMFISS